MYRRGRKLKHVEVKNGTFSDSYEDFHKNQSWRGSRLGYSHFKVLYESYNPLLEESLNEPDFIKGASEDAFDLTDFRLIIMPQ